MEMVLGPGSSTIQSIVFVFSIDRPYIRPMILPTLRQLQYLKLLSEHGSFSRAAETQVAGVDTADLLVARFSPIPGRSSGPADRPWAAGPPVRPDRPGQQLADDVVPVRRAGETERQVIAIAGPEPPVPALVQRRVEPQGGRIELGPAVGADIVLGLSRAGQAEPSTSASSAVLAPPAAMPRPRWPSDRPRVRRRTGAHRDCPCGPVRPARRARRSCRRAAWRSRRRSSGPRPGRG
jgi:hypothetical protein